MPFKYGGLVITPSNFLKFLFIKSLALLTKNFGGVTLSFKLAISLRISSIFFLVNNKMSSGLFFFKSFLVLNLTSPALFKRDDLSKEE